MRLFNYLPVTRRYLEVRLMATKQEVLDAVREEAEEVAARVNALDMRVKELEDMVIAGGQVTAADLDEIRAAVRNIHTPPAP